MMKRQPTLTYKSNRLYFRRHDLLKIARAKGTPSYVYCFDRVKENLNDLAGAFRGPIHIHYAMKANANAALLSKLRQLNSKNRKVGVDVVSGGEILRALDSGFTGSQIIFSGVGKRQEEVELALYKKILMFNVESPQELERIGQTAKLLKKRADVSFRLNPNVDPKTHPYITTGFKNNKFGMDKSFLPELLKILRRYPSALNLLGLDFHIGSQLIDIKPFLAAAKNVIPIFQDLRSQGFALTHLDIGGGVGIPYKGGTGLDIKKYGHQIEKLLRPLGCDLILEPGRFLVADAGVLLSQVEYVKKTPHKTFVILNTGMHHLIRPALYGAHHEILPLEKSSRRKIKMDVVGPICESSDFLAQNRVMPELRQGEWVAICDAGAYGYTMVSDYNLQPRPKEIVLP